MYKATPDTPQSIWHQRGQPKPTAKIGINQEWILEYSASWEVESATVENERINGRTDQSTHHQDPKTDEEDDDQDYDSPFRNVLVVPQVAPISTAARNVNFTRLITIWGTY